VTHAEADFINQTLTFTCSPKEHSRIAGEMTAMISKEEPSVEVSEFSIEKKGDEEETEGKGMLVRLIIGAILFTAGMLTSGTVQIVLSLAAYFLLGYDVIFKALRNMGRGQLFDENFLMTVATAAAIYLHDWREAAGVMLFYQIGEYFQDLAVARSRKSIGDLMDIRPEFAMVQENGEYVKRNRKK